MKKYSIITFIVVLSAACLEAQKLDSIETVKEKEDPALMVTPSVDQELNKQTDEITITGPDGVIIREPVENYSIKKEKYSMENDKSLRNDERLKNDDQESFEKKETGIIYSFPDSNRDNRHFSEGRKKSDIRTLSGSENHSGGFGAISFRYSDFKGDPLVLAGFRAGWIENRTVAIGFEGHGVIPTGRYEDIDLNRDMILVGGYGGMFLEFILFSNQPVHVTFPVSAGGGWLGYTGHWDNNIAFPEDRNQLADDDMFWYIEPGANLEFNVSRNFRMCFGLSKRVTRDFMLVNTSNSAFEKPNYYLTLKFGRF